MKSNPEWNWLIFNPANCVLRHHETLRCWHTPGVGGDEIFEKCARQLVSYEGKSVRAFLEAMLQYYPTNARSQLLRFDAISF